MLVHELASEENATDSQQCHTASRDDQPSQHGASADGGEAGCDASPGESGRSACCRDGRDGTRHPDSGTSNTAYRCSGDFFDGFIVWFFIHDSKDF